MSPPRPKPAPPKKSAGALEIPPSLSGDAALRLEEPLAAALEAAGKEFTLDLTPVTEIDARGLALCLGVCQECRQRNITLLVRARPEVGSVLERLKLTRLMNVTPA